MPAPSASEAVGSAEMAARRLQMAIEQALRAHPERVVRLHRTRVSVRFEVEGSPDAVTLLLDRQPAEVVLGDEPAEVVIELSAEQAAAMAAGALPMPATLARGHASGTGPVRRYLEVDPILQGLLEQCADGHRTFSRRNGKAPAVLDRDLLAIEARGLCKAFGRNHVLEGVDLTIPEGVISVILGPSGTGKSVMLQHIIGLMKPDAGEVRIRGRGLSGMSHSELLNLRRGVGVMFQDGALFSAMDVFDNVAFPLREHTDLDDDEIREVVMTRLREVGLEHAAARLPSQLSGGMKKRAGLARALVLDPGIVLCDEPDSGLDPVRTALLADLLLEEHAIGGGTMVVVTHNIALAKQVASHMSVLWKGQVVTAGMAQDVLASEDPFVQQFLDGQVHGPLGMD